MDKSQAIHNFWSSFGLTAYDENTVPDDAQMPYITYNVPTADIDETVVLNARLWYHSTSWAEVSRKADEIAEYIGHEGHKVMRLDNGFVWFVKGSPFSQRTSDEADSMIRSIYLNVTAEYLTMY